MKKLLIISLFSIFWSLSAQGIEVQGEVPFKPGFSVKTMESATGTLTYGIEYPRGFDKSKKYSILLCLPGGDFAVKLASYYNWVYTPRRTFKDYIKIYPITNKENNILSFKKKDWNAYIEAIQINENGNDRDWVISGASNGGLATFDIISANPDIFRGFIVIPGRLKSQPILKEWMNLDALIVYGTEDSGWVKPSINTYNKLKGKVRAIDLIALEGIEHVLPVTFNIEPIYQAFEDLTP